jgi:hypothetical protein
VPVTTPAWRKLYDKVERVVTPYANAITHSDGFAQSVAFRSGVEKAVKAQSNKLAAKGWHLLNLPAGTDVQRLRMQVGALDREVRLLTLELRRARAEEVVSDGVDADSDEHP